MSLFDREAAAYEIEPEGQKHRNHPKRTLPKAPPKAEHDHRLRKHGGQRINCAVGAGKKEDCERGQPEQTPRRLPVPGLLQQGVETQVVAEKERKGREVYPTRTVCQHLPLIQGKDEQNEERAHPDRQPIFLAVAPQQIGVQCEEKGAEHHIEHGAVVKEAHIHNAFQVVDRNPGQNIAVQIGR